jgi:hypothetical protein
MRAALHPRGVGAALGAVWPGGLPPRLAGLIDAAACGARWADFKLGPVLPLEPPGPGGPRPPRLALADAGEPAAWAAKVRAAWPEAGPLPFLELAPGARRMVDSDGGPGLELYLDDLQQVAHGFAAAPDGAPLLARALRLPAGAETRLSRRAAPPGGLPAPLAAWAEGLRARGASGLWAPRWAAPSPAGPWRAEGLLWINEARWRGGAAATAALVEALGPPPAWGALCAAMGARGWRAYPDTIELRLHPDDPGRPRLDLTVGFVPAGA